MKSKTKKEKHISVSKKIMTSTTTDSSPPSKATTLINKLLPDWSTYTELRTRTAFIIRCYTVGTFYGMLFGAGIPASPLLYKTFQSNAGAQLNIIFTFTMIGFVSSAVPYGLFLDNAPKPPPPTPPSTDDESKKLVQVEKDYSRTWIPQFRSVFSPLWLGLSCWAAGHMYYPGRFVVQFEEKGTRFREFTRLTVKTAIALHRVHLPFALGWSLFFGLLCYPFRKPHHHDHDLALENSPVVVKF